MKQTYTVKGKVIKYPGMAGWYFFGLPKKESAEIKKTYGAVARGWGSIKVVATIGETSWSTSIFPDKKSNTYVLPLKAQVRKSEGVTGGATIRVTLHIQ